MTTRMVGPLVALTCVLGAAEVASQAVPQAPPRILIDSVTGRDSFDLYCASCHGPTARGDGPIARELRTRPTDLSTLAQRNQGSFPRDQVRDYIVGTGRSVAAHGTTDMPVWGPIFQALEPEGRARERMENLLTHLQSLQRPSTGANDPGAQAFKTYCATCHGATGRGGGPVAAQLRHVPPDLTTFSRRNGGVFPSARLARIIDGRDVQSHGDREMPVWGDAFRVTSGGMSPAQIDDRIAAILRYLESIQERPAE